MKKIVPVLFLLASFPSLVLACSCANSLYTTNDWYATSDFVGTIKITATVETPDSTEWKTYEARIQSLATFKGKAPNKLHVLGSKDGKNWVSSCDETVKSGEEYLAAISKNENGKYFISYCSYLRKLKSSEGKNVSRASDWRAVKHFQFLKRHVPALHQEFRISESSNKLSDYLKSYEGQSFDEESAHYLISFDKQFEIKSIKVLKGFSTEFDSTLITFLKKETTWGKSRLTPDDVQLKNEPQKVLGIYYYQDETKFLSQFD